MKSEDPFQVFRREFRVQIGGVDGLGRQLGDEAAGVGQILTESDRLAAEGSGVVHPGVVVDVGEGLELHAKSPAVAHQVVVVNGDAGRAGVEVHVRVVVELAALLIAHLVDQIA